jgi:hypothetical protein
VWPEGGNHFDQKLLRVDGTLYGLCVWCQRRGSRQLLEVPWVSVERLLARMRKHGPEVVTVALATDAIEAAALRKVGASDTH